MPLSRSVSIHSHRFSVLDSLSRNSVSDKNIISISSNVNVCHGQLTFLQLPAEVEVLTIELPDDRELHFVIALGQYNMPRTGVSLFFLICTCQQVWLPLHTHSMWLLREISADGVSLCALGKGFYTQKPLSSVSMKIYYRLQLDFNLKLFVGITSAHEEKTMHKTHLNPEVK